MINLNIIAVEILVMQRTFEFVQFTSLDLNIAYCSGTEHTTYNGQKCTYIRVFGFYTVIIENRTPLI